MADFTQAPAGVLDAIAHQEVTHSSLASSTVIGATITPTAGALWAEIHMHHAFIEAVVNTNPGSFEVQKNLETTGENWVTVAPFTTTDATPNIETPSNAEGIGDTVIEVASTTGFVPGEFLYFRDVVALAQSEWHQIRSIVANVSITLMDGLVVAKGTDDRLFSDAGHFSMILDLSGVARWRTNYIHQGAIGANTAIWVRYIEVTDFE